MEWCSWLHQTRSMPYSLLEQFRIQVQSGTDPYGGCAHWYGLERWPYCVTCKRRRSYPIDAVWLNQKKNSFFLISLILKFIGIRTANVFFRRQWVCLFLCRFFLHINRRTILKITVYLQPNIKALILVLLNWTPVDKSPPLWQKQRILKLSNLTGVSRNIWLVR